MREEEVGEEEKATVEIIWQDEWSEFAFCNAGMEDSSVGRQNFDVGWSWTHGGEEGEERFFGHADGFGGGLIYRYGNDKEAISKD